MSPIVSEAEALRALEVFESVGVTLFYPMHIDEATGAVADAAIVDGVQLRQRLQFYLGRNANSNVSFVIDVLDQAIQIDDCDEVVHTWLQPYSFLTVKTSPGNYQAWLCLSDRAAFPAIRERLLRRLIATSANGAWYGGLRWPGSRNCKPKHRLPDGSFPMVQNRSVSPGRRVTPAELKDAGLLAPPPWPVRPFARKMAMSWLYAAGIARLAAWCNRKRVLILCYPGITKKTDYAPQSYRGPLHLAHLHFVEQLAYLRRRYCVVSLSEYLVALRENRPLPDYSVVLAFEEAHRNFLTVALPILSEFSMPATVFLVPECLHDLSEPGATPSWLVVDDQRHLSWVDVTLLQQHKIEFGLLLCSERHAPATARDKTMQRLREGYGALVLHTGQHNPPLAFSAGQYTAAAVQEASRIGFSCAVAHCDWPANEAVDSPFALQRIAARDFADDRLAAFAVHISGFKWWWGRFT